MYNEIRPSNQKPGLGDNGMEYKASMLATPWLRYIYVGILYLLINAYSLVFS